LLVIPVLDLRAGRIVRADARLRREQYPALVSPLCPDATPGRLLAAIAGAPAMRCVYVADLDALTGRPPQIELLAQLAAEFPGLDFWCDLGLADLAALHALPLPRNLVPVLASESWSGPLPDDAELARCVLSLDRRAGRDIGQGRIRIPSVPGLDVILMCLDRMGNPEGPDFEGLQAQRRASPAARLHLAGGIRGPADVERASALGAAGVLTATALHDGRIGLS
jgi:phosphoribosylformimino-5-aminoimidazole carboxamide ribotide isomerase